MNACVYRILFVFLLAVFLFPAFASAATYYVATNGNDASSGTEASPWRTIQKAANTLVAGDTVYVKQGTYNERIIPKNSGTSSGYINFIAYPGQSVTLDGSGLSLANWDGMVHINGKSYIKVSGFNIVNTHEAGIHVDNSKFITIEKNTVTLNGLSLSPIKVGWGYSSDIIIDGNTVYRSTDPSCTGDSVRYCWEEMISISNGERITVKNNIVLLNGIGEGIVTKDGTKDSKIFSNNIEKNKAGIYIGGWEVNQNNIDVYNNIVHDNTQGILIGTEKGAIMQYINIYNNILYNNKDSGIILSSYAASTAYPPQIKDVNILNNNLYNNGIGSWGGGGIQIEADRGNNMRISNVIIRNNIVSKNKDYQIGIESGSPYVVNTVINNNLVDGTKGYYENDGTNSVVIDPKFLNPSVADFHLQSLSPAIDKGYTAGAPYNVDYDGKTRPIGAAYDIGAYEYGSSSVCTPSWRCESPLNGYEADGCNNRRLNSACNAPVSTGSIKIMGANHPNLWYNQAEIDKMRAIIFGSEPAVKKAELVNIYNTRAKGAMAANPPANWFTTEADGCCWNGGLAICEYPACITWRDAYMLGLSKGVENLKAGVSYMIEPTDAKAQAIRTALLQYAAYEPWRYRDPQNMGHIVWSIAWLYDLSYNHLGLYSAADKTTIETFFRNIASEMKSFQGNGYTNMWRQVQNQEGISREGYENWYAFYAGQGVIASLVGNDQSLLDFFTKSQNTQLWYTPTSQGASASNPNPATSHMRDLYQYVNGMVFPSGATWDYYTRDNPAFCTSGSDVSNRCAAEGKSCPCLTYHEFSLVGIYMGLEAAAHNGWNGWNENVVNGKPAMQRAIDWQIQNHPVAIAGGKYPNGRSAMDIRRFYNSDPIVKAYFDSSDGNNIDTSSHMFGDIGRIFVYPMYGSTTTPIPQSPYGGTVRAIPGTIQAEDFDNGGEGVAYHDSEAANQGNSYRTGEGVDIEASTAGGYNIGWTLAGEWLEYSVNAASAGTYSIEIPVASYGSGGTFHIEFNGVDKTGTMTVPDTGGWQSWATLTKSVSLSAGTQIIKIVMDTVGATGNMGNIDYVKLSSGTTPPPACTPSWKCESPLNGYEYDGCNNRRLNVACSSTSQVPPGYNLVWSDEFNSGTLDTSKWVAYTDSDPAKYWGSGDAYQREAARNSNRVTFADGNLLLTTAMTGSNPITGEIQSLRTFSYGYTEYRVKCPHITGTSCQFFQAVLNGNGVDSNNWETEVSAASYYGGDGENRTAGNAILTISGGNPTSGYQHYHMEDMPDSFWANYHTYGVERTSSYVSYRIDGVEYFRETSPTFLSSSDFTMFLYNWWGKNYVTWSLAGNNAELPSIQYVDYVRFYQKGASCTPNWKCESPLNGYEYDGCGNRRTNPACAAPMPSADNPPSVSAVHSPASPTTATSVAITASATDDKGLSQISVYVDNALKNTCNVSGTSNTCSYASAFSEGTHSYYATAKDTLGQITTSATRQFSVSAPPAPAAKTLADATDNSLIWTTGGNANWFGEQTTYYYGNDAAQSGKISDSQTSWMQTTVTGPGKVTFYWKVSSEPYYDYLKFYIDGLLKIRMSGSVNWNSRSYTLTSGTHTLKWAYVKDRNTVKGSDAGWVDKVVYTPSTPTGYFLFNLKKSP